MRRKALRVKEISYSYDIEPKRLLLSLANFGVRKKRTVTCS